MGTHLGFFLARQCHDFNLIRLKLFVITRVRTLQEEHVVNFLGCVVYGLFEMVVFYHLRGHGGSPGGIVLRRSH